MQTKIYHVVEGVYRDTRMDPWDKESPLCLFYQLVFFVSVRNVLFSSSVLLLHIFRPILPPWNRLYPITKCVHVQSICKWIEYKGFQNP